MKVEQGIVSTPFLCHRHVLHHTRASSAKHNAPAMARPLGGTVVLYLSKQPVMTMTPQRCTYFSGCASKGVFELNHAAPVW